MSSSQNGCRSAPAPSPRSTRRCSGQRSLRSTPPGRATLRRHGCARSCVPAEVRVFADADELGATLAEEVLTRYDASDGPYLLGCPGGRSLRTTYRALAAHGRAL